MKNKTRFQILLLFILLVFLIYLLPLQGFIDYYLIKYIKKSPLQIVLSKVNPDVKFLSVQSENNLVLRIKVVDNSGLPQSNIRVLFDLDKKYGYIYPDQIKTNKFGEALVSYIPEISDFTTFSDAQKKVLIKAKISGSNTTSSSEIMLTAPPVILVHGYKADGTIFDNLSEYLTSKSFSPFAISYDTNNGVAECANSLNSFIEQKRLELASKGIQVGQFNIIAHSMGGLVTRYYTTSQRYLTLDNVNKIIFVSVPHHGSPLASVAAKYYTDQGTQDLIPDNQLYKKHFPKALNQGLNPNIQVGNLLGKYDEVVSEESANLKKWKLDTELFNIGKSNFTLDNLISGKILESTIHKAILSNKKVFEKIEIMLKGTLPKPLKLKED